MREPLLRQAPLEKGARVYPGRRVRLEVDQVALLPGAEEVVEADFEKIRGRGVARDMAAELGVGAIRAHHHGEGVPAHDAEMRLSSSRFPGNCGWSASATEFL